MRQWTCNILSSDVITVGNGTIIIKESKVSNGRLASLRRKLRIIPLGQFSTTDNTEMLATS